MRFSRSTAPSFTIRYNEMMAVQITPDQQIWVTTNEAEELTGYNRRYLKQMAHKNSHLPEDERLIKVRMRSGRFYELWLPDLLRYIDEIGYGPHLNKNKPK